jgi:predicted nucleotide-binding protein
MEKRMCFLIAPIGLPGSEVRKRSDTLLTYVVEPAVQEVDYDLLRADQITTPGAITAQIIRSILDAPLVIADLSGSNPNVMYELAIRHTSGKPAIQITTDISSLPFDIAVMRTIVVDINDLKSVANAKEILVRTIIEIEQSGITFESPVSAAADIRSFQKLNKEEVGSEDITSATAILNILKDMDSRLKTLEYTFSRNTKGPEVIRDYSRRIFIVHGHDGELKNELARLLEKLDFEPVILHEQPDRGQTVFSKLNGEMSDVGFAFIILTPDDVGYLATNSSDSKPRARQNVVFEHGLFAGYLKPERVCAIRKGNVEAPSDLQGVLYKPIPEGGGIRSIALEIANELRAAGYILDANKLLKI